MGGQLEDISKTQIHLRMYLRLSYMTFFTDSLKPVSEHISTVDRQVIILGPIGVFKRDVNKEAYKNHRRPIKTIYMSQQNNTLYELSLFKFYTMTNSLGKHETTNRAHKIL